MGAFPKFELAFDTVIVEDIVHTGYTCGIQN